MDRPSAKQCRAAFIADSPMSMSLQRIVSQYGFCRRIIRVQIIPDAMDDRVDIRDFNMTEGLLTRPVRCGQERVQLGWVPVRTRSSIHDAGPTSRTVGRLRHCLRPNDGAAADETGTLADTASRHTR